MWLDGIDQESAKKRAHAMIEDSAIFKKFSGNEKQPLGLSIGVLKYNSESDEDIDRLLHRADEAMYNVKRQSKGGFAFAEFDPAAD